jgi:hypothetical protein
MPSSRSFQRWDAAISLGFAAICIRLFVATALTPQSAPTLLLAAGGLALGYWRPAPAWFALAAAVPTLSGLVRVGLLPGPVEPLTLLGGMWIGVGLHRLLRGGPPSPLRLGTLRVTLNALLSLGLLSLGWQIARHCGEPEFWAQAWHQPTQGYTGTQYFWTAALLWLSGLIYFREILDWAGARVSEWIRPVVLIHAATIAIFLVIEHQCGLPENWGEAGLFSPFEDLSSAGTMAACLFIYLAARTGRPFSRLAAWELGAAVVASGAVVAAWSRGAWLATGVWLTVVIARFLPRKWTIGIVAAAVAGVCVLNQSFPPLSRTTWSEHPYLSRLVSLTRFESIEEKSSGRLELFYKAWGMIRERPLTGHGIGAFYSTSVRYAKPGDSLGQKPEFAHNIVLQVAAEQGAPAAILFLGLIGFILVRTWRPAAGAAESNGARRQRHALGLALAAYLQTSLTANSLLIHPSHPTFFWLLAAALLALSAPSPSAEAKTD